MKLKDVVIRILRKAYRETMGLQFLNPICDMDRQSVNLKILNLLNSDKPCMISRFGTTELNCINNFLTVKSKESYLKKYLAFITQNTHTPWWNEEHFKVMSLYSGIFPPSIETSENFSLRYLNDIPLIDLLGSFQYYEKYMPLNPHVFRAQLETLYPFFVDIPWTQALRDKNVLVVHPFEESIKSQFLKRESIFKNKDILPEFNLITLKSVQSIAGSKVAFKDWFCALAYMESQISNINFDICILGCGAYGLPLAAHVKRIGRKSIHLGGGTQLLFGIKGKRWVEQYAKEWNYRPGESINLNYSDLFNDTWVYPSEIEKPQNANAVEDSCYW